MGCTSSTEELEAKILKLKIKRTGIREERKKKIARLEKLTGEEIKRESVPDCYAKTENDGSINNNKKKEKK